VALAATLLQPPAPTDPCPLAWSVAAWMVGCAPWHSRRAVWRRRTWETWVASGPVPMCLCACGPVCLWACGPVCLCACVPGCACVPCVPVCLCGPVWACVPVHKVYPMFCRPHVHRGVCGTMRLLQVLVLYVLRVLPRGRCAAGGGRCKCRPGCGGSMPPWGWGGDGGGWGWGWGTHLRPFRRLTMWGRHQVFLCLGWQRCLPVWRACKGGWWVHGRAVHCWATLVAFEKPQSTFRFRLGWGHQSWSCG
jgi:hypothetical protein